MKIYEYENYDDYVAWQTKVNKEKLSWVYVKEKVINAIVEDKKEATNIICHGTRSGAEQIYFKKHFPEAYIIGTEISDTATKFPMTIQHDFTFQKDEWINKFDIVYSNSIDHSIDPESTLCTWRDQLSKNGKLYIEYSEERSVCHPHDPLDATNDEIKKLIINANMKILYTLPGRVRNDIVFVCMKEK